MTKAPSTHSVDTARLLFVLLVLFVPMLLEVQPPKKLLHDTSDSIIVVVSCDFGIRI